MAINRPLEKLDLLPLAVLARVVFSESQDSFSYGLFRGFPALPLHPFVLVIPTQLSSLFFHLSLLSRVLWHLLGLNSYLASQSHPFHLGLPPAICLSGCAPFSAGLVSQWALYVPFLPWVPLCQFSPATFSTPVCSPDFTLSGYSVILFYGFLRQEEQMT